MYAAGICERRVLSLKQFHRQPRRCGPIAPAARRNQEFLSIELKQINGRRVKLAGLPAPHLEKVVVRKPQAQPNKESVGAVKNTLTRRRYTKSCDPAIYQILVCAS